MERKLLNDPLYGDSVADDAATTEEKPRKTHVIEQVLCYVGAPLICLAFFITYLAILGIYPFGKSVMSSYDLLAQIAPFTEHLFDVFEGKSGLFYSFSVAGGADVFGTLAYCLISPFTFIFLLGGRGMVNYMVPFVLAAKIAAISLSATFAVKKLFPSIHTVTAVMLAVLYTYSGYFHVANTYINWLDFLIYLPLITVAFSRFIKTGKYLAFSLLVALFIYTCFSIACFSMLIIFLILFAYVLFCVEKDLKKETLTKLCMSLVLAVGVALPLIIPALKAYTSSGRNTGLFSNLDNPLNATHLYNKLSYVVIDVIFFTVTLWYFIVCDKKEGINKFLMVTGGLILAPVLIDEICLLLNAGSYMSYSLRFGFLNSVFGLYVTARAFSGKKLKSEPFNKKWLISSIIAMIMLALCCLTVYSLQDIIFNGKDSFIFDTLIKPNTLLYNMFEEAGFSESFSSKFAHSIGGLEIIVFLFAVMGLSALAVIIMAKYKFMPVRVAAVTLICIALLQTGFTSYHTVRGNRNTMITYEQVQTVLDKVDELEDGDFTQYRIKDYNDKLSSNASITLQYRSFGVFSSVVSSKNFDAQNLFGYYGNGVNSTKSSGGNIFSDCLLGYKYAFSTSNGLTVGIWKKVEQYDPFTLFENEYVFPTAFTIPVGRYDVENGNYADKLNSLYTYLGGEGELMIRREPSEVVYEEEGDFFRVSMYSAENCAGNTYVIADLPDGVEASYTDGEAYDPADCKGMGKDFHLYTGYTRALNSREFSIKATKGELTEEILKESLFTATVSLSKVKELCKIARDNEVKVDFGKNKISADTSGIEGDRMLFVNYVNADGYSFYVDGKRIEAEESDLSFITVKLDDDATSVEMNYRSPFIKYILFGVALGALLAAAMILAFKYYAKIKKLFERVAVISADLLALGIFGFGFVYPFILFLVKCVMALFRM